MRKLILHIGMHKTGSSSIQESLDGLDTGEVRYASLGVANHSIPIYTIFSADRYNFFTHVRRGFGPPEIDRERQRYLSMLRQELELDRPIRIISGEDMTRLSEQELRNLKDFVTPYCDEISVIGYARTPADYASSMYQQMIKVGRNPEDVPSVEYRNIFSKFFTVFGRDNVRIFDFSAGHLAGGSIVADFLQRVGLAHTSIQEKRSNESMSRLTTKLLYAFNDAGPLAGGDDLLVTARDGMMRFLVSHFQDARFKLPDAVAEQAVSPEDIEWLYHETGIDYRSCIPATLQGLPSDWCETLLGSFSEEDLGATREMLRGMNVRHLETDDIPTLLSRLYYSILLRSTISAIDADALKQAAMKFELKQPLSREESIYLLQLANWVRPTDASITGKLQEYRAPPDRPTPTKWRAA